KVRQSNTRAAFCTNSRQLLVWNCLHPRMDRDNNVARREALLKWQPVAKAAVARYGADPILSIESFRLKVRRQQPVINVENNIELPVFHSLRNAPPPRKKFKLYLITAVRVLSAQGRKHDCTNVIRA